MMSRVVRKYWIAVLGCWVFTGEGVLPLGGGRRMVVLVVIVVVVVGVFRCVRRPGGVQRCGVFAVVWGKGGG